ncbi:MAG: hypothetical protein H0V17_33940 [Deltaproteobacteria bacterium]|nr:hypothetical protein [Deltaproteobacteria bacterium]
MSVATVPTGLTRGIDATRLALAAAGPIAIGGVLALRAGDPSPLAATPAIVFGIAAATCPALYIAIAATKQAPTLAGVVRALGTSFGAFGIALAGLVLPALFLSLSSTSEITTFAVCSVVLGGAAVLAMVRLAGELAPKTFMGGLVCFVWAAATLGIAGRLWFDLAAEVLL